MSAPRSWVVVLPVSEETLADARGFMDRFAQSLAADEASRDERYGGVYRRGYHAGADAAFAALLTFIAAGGRVGLPMSPDSLHVITASGSSGEILSLLALRPAWPSEPRA